MKRIWPWLMLSLVLVLMSCNQSPSDDPQTSLPAVVDYNFHIKPIISDRCFKCHGPDENTREANFRLDTRDGMFAAIGEQKDHFAILPGQPDSSAILHRLTTENPDDRMPPPESNLSVSEYEIALIRKWIEQGANWKKHWSLIPPVKSASPAVNDASWPQNEIDRFVLARLQQESLKPSPQASRETLIRRVTFDLTGLPPTLQEIEDFLQDDAANAYEKVVDRLLTSADYGEKMAVYWLDAARYADTHGYQDDLPRTMWPWRDWVINAFNENLSYDQFVRWQLAGDLLPNATAEQILATGFNRNHKITQEGGVIDEEYRTEYVADRTQTFGTVFMGLTVECARCHDHKYDQFTTQEFYELFAFFNNVPEKGVIEYDNKTPEPKLSLTPEEVRAKLPFITHIDSGVPLETMVMQDMPEARHTFILKRGEYDHPTTAVQAATPANLATFPQDAPANRLGLAEWLLSPEHPLFSRVTVNRFWQQYFGQGIVATADDFGNQGSLPTHPALLDWLAVTFRESGWDVKEFQKMIVMSATYRQSSQADEALLKRDPANELLARGPRYRLPAEVIRDNALAISGLLVKKIGGPSVKPYQPDGLWAETTSGQGLTKYVPDVGDKLYRKSLYTFWKRTVPPPSMMTFDAASRDLCIVRRQSTSTPLQSLVLINDPQMVEAARMMAVQMMQVGDQSSQDALVTGFRMATSRFPGSEELSLLKEMYAENLARFKETPEAATELLGVGETPLPDDIDKIRCAALTVVASTLLNLYETVTKT